METLKVRVNVVQLFFNVKDKKGALIPSQTKDDFELLEDGKPQTIETNPTKVTAEEPVSTFSIDVDTASYSWVRASLNQNVLPQPAAVRTEEMVNYFRYDYPTPRSAAEPFSTNVAVFPSPWAPGRKLVRIGAKRERPS